MKKRNMLRKITAIILAVTMLIPTNIYAYDNTYVNPSEDPNIYIDKNGNSHVIADMEVYYNHPHWKVVEAWGKSHYFYNVTPATSEKDGVLRANCPTCDETLYLRIPRIKTVKNRNTKYTWEEIAMALVDYSYPAEPFFAVSKFLTKKTYFIDSENKKIEPYAWYDANSIFNRKYKKSYRYRIGESDFLIGKIDYTLSNLYGFYEPIECSYTVTPPDCYIWWLDPYKYSVQIACNSYTKNKKYAKNLKKYGDLYLDYLSDDAEILVSTDKTFKNKKKIKTVLGSSITKNKNMIKNLKQNTTYYFKYRVFKVVDGEKYYSSWSPVRSIKTLNGKKKCMYYKRKDFKNPGYEMTYY